jgi:hypothetical protein
MRKYMDEFKNLMLTIVTENQNQKINAEKLAVLLQIELGKGWEIQNIEEYSKFENSFKIELKANIKGLHYYELNHLAISLADKLVSPWLVYFDNDDNSIELIFNKDQNTRSRRTEFDVIKWGQLQISK